MIKVFLIYTLLFTPVVVFANEATGIHPTEIYTLYRSSATTNGADMRIHVATFDAESGQRYNRTNCKIAEILFQTQPGVTVDYWCERGYFSKK